MYLIDFLRWRQFRDKFQEACAPHWAPGPDREHARDDGHNPQPWAERHRGGGARHKDWRTAVPRRDAHKTRPSGCWAIFISKMHRAHLIRRLKFFLLCCKSVAKVVEGGTSIPPDLCSPGYGGPIGDWNSHQTLFGSPYFTPK